jgi:D-alanyl-D-alanine carboxypeptidase
MKTLTPDNPMRGLHGSKGTALALLMTMSLAWAREMDSAMTEKFQAMLDARAKSLNGAGMIKAVRMPGRDVWVGAAGYAQRGGEVLTDAKGQPRLDPYGLPRREGSQLMRPDDLMYVDSCSKTHIAALVMRLVAEEALSLNDTLAQWLPQCQIPNADRITLRQMLNHTSGIYMLNTPEIRKYLRGKPNGPYAPWEMVGLVAGRTPFFEPGATNRWEYSVSNYLLLGLIIEKACGQSLAKATRDRLFRPLSLNHSYSAGLEPMPKLQAIPYQEDGTAAPFYSDYSWTFGAGHIVTSLADLVRFMEHLAQGKYVSAALVQQMITPCSETGYALGLFRFTIPSGPLKGTLLHNTGGGFGTHSVMYHHMESGVTVAAAANIRLLKAKGLDSPLAVASEALALAVTATAGAS